MDEEILTKEVLETRARVEIGKSLERSLAQSTVDNLVTLAQDQIEVDLSRGSLDFWFWRDQGFSPQAAAEIVEKALDDFLSQYRVYPPDFVLPYERLRSSVQKGKVPNFRPYAGRPLVTFGLVVHGLQLVDPINLIFELQGEASVGVPLAHAVGYLEEPPQKDPFEALGAKISHDGVLHFHDLGKEKKIRCLLQIRMRGGRLEESYSYFRYGIASGRVWLIQEFSAYFYLPADFKNLPFDKFPVVADFNVGLGGDVVNVELDIDKASAQAPLSREFDAGEFQHEKANVTLTSIAYLHDPTHFVDNVARLSFRIRRSPRNMMLRIGLPLILMAGLLLAGSWFKVDQMESQIIPAVLVAMVALQLTAAQGMPRDASFSVLDRCFVTSYLLAVVLFLLPLVSDWSGRELKFVVGACTLAYFTALAAILYRPWKRRTEGDLTNAGTTTARESSSNPKRPCPPAAGRNMENGGRARRRSGWTRDHAGRGRSL